ncbi:MAG: ATP cone domain-containing protein [Candidatus Korarchaeota archaeon]|nr:ATP cone domain-containing protein [Candidatus Korarchaeota archaeon]
MKVRKRSTGTEEEFLPVKIVAAAIKAGASVELADEVAKAVQEKFKGKDVVDSSEIREFVLNYLKEREPSAYENWLRFDSRVKGISS